MAILTATDFKTYTGLSGTAYDTRLAVLIPAVQDMLERMSGRLFDAATYTEYQNGRGVATVMVNNPPIRSVTSVQLVDADGTVEFTYAADDYAATVGPDNTDAGLITLVPNALSVELDTEYASSEVRAYGTAPSFPDGTRNVKVVYAGGFSTMPTSLVLDMVRLVSIAVGQTTNITDLSMNSERLGDYQYQRNGGSGIAALGVLGQAATSLDAAVYAVAQKWKVVR